MDFYERKDLNNMKLFLLEERVEKLSKQGLFYFVNEFVIKFFKLYFEYGGMIRFYELMYEIYESYWLNMSIKFGYKRQFVKFFKYNFENFEGKLLEIIMCDLCKIFKQCN